MMIAVIVTLFWMVQKIPLDPPMGALLYDDTGFSIIFDVLFS
jgi:hypothetical protein